MIPDIREDVEWAVRTALGIEEPTIEQGEDYIRCAGWSPRYDKVCAFDLVADYGGRVAWTCGQSAVPMEVQESLERFLIKKMRKHPDWRVYKLEQKVKELECQLEYLGEKVWRED